MSFWDKLMGRGKKAAGDVADDESLRSEGAHQEAGGHGRGPRGIGGGNRSGSARGSRGAPRRARQQLRAPSDPISSVLRSHVDRAAHPARIRGSRRRRRSGCSASCGSSSPRCGPRPATQLAERNAEVDRRLEAMTSTLDRRLEGTAQTAGDIQRRLGELGRANEEILARANDLKRLEQALRPPKARGGFGELLLAEPSPRPAPGRRRSQLQYGFSTGERVDAVIKVDRLVPIDSKFPLDNFERMVERRATTIERAAAREALRTRREEPHRRDRLEVHPARRGDVRLRVHVPPVGGRSTTSSRAGRPVRCSPTRTTSGSSPSRRRRCTAYLQVIVLGLKGLQIEQHAQEVMAYCAQLQKDFGRFGGLRARRDARRPRAEQVRRRAEAARALRDEARAGGRLGRGRGRARRRSARAAPRSRRRVTPPSASRARARSRS